MDYPTEVALKDGLQVAQYLCHDAAYRAGWWGEGYELKQNPLAFSNKLCLIHSEISEAMEGDRKNLKDDKLPHRDMREVELADGKLNVSIGIDILAFAVTAGQDWPEGAFVNDNLAFAEDIRTALLDEQEDGTTLVHLAFDRAAKKVLENCETVTTGEQS